MIADGLSEKEINELEKLLPVVSNLCKKITTYSIKESIVQPDFHDNNLLIDNQLEKITFIDFGEIVISHPFFSLVNCLWQAKKHHALKDEGDGYKKLLDACLKNYIDVESKNNLLEAFSSASLLFFVFGALAHERLMNACGKENLMLYQRGKLSSWLKEFIIASDSDSK